MGEQFQWRLERVLGLKGIADSAQFLFCLVQYKGVVVDQGYGLIDNINIQYF